MTSGKACVLVLAIVIAGCLKSSSVQCDFGICPTGSSCDDVNHVCIPPGCGDGIVQGAEECDGAVPMYVDCTDLGFYSPAGLACSPSCTYDTSQCVGTCGDHITQNPPELCDGIPPVGTSCTDYGFEIGRIQCSEECSVGFSGCATIGWQVGHGNAPGALNAIWGSAQNDMYTVGEGGAILHGDGVVWVPMTSNTTADLNGVWGSGPTDIFAVGTGGTIVHFDGTTWTPMSSGVSVQLQAVSGKLTDVYAVGNGGTILHYNGTTWTPEISTVNVVLRGVWAEASFVMVVGDATAAGTGSPTALRRDTATPTWTAMTVPSITLAAGSTEVPTLNAVWGLGSAFVAVGTAAFVSTGVVHGTVLQFNGTTWGYTMDMLAPDELESVWGVESVGVDNVARTDIFIGGKFGTLMHYDGIPGTDHFRIEQSNTTRQITGLWGTGPAYVRASTLGGTVQEFDGTNLITTLAGPIIEDLEAVWDDPVGGIGVAVGLGGTVVQHTSQGWQTPYTVASIGDLYAVWGSGSTVFIGGTNGIAMSTNAGASFGAPVATSGAFSSLWGLSTTDVYGSGMGGSVWRYNGVSWTQGAALTGSPHLTGIWGTSDADIFVVGHGGVIQHYDGASWTAQSSGVTADLLGIWGSSSTDVFVAGTVGTILHYDGTTWHKMTSNTGQDLEAVSGTTHADVFISGRGVILHYLGVSWAPMVNFGDVYGSWIGTDDSFFVGGNGEAMELGRVSFLTENRCSDPWDNDYNGLGDCADPGCSIDSGCQAGGPCSPVTPIACGGQVTASTYTGFARIDDLPCLSHSTPGPEAAYRLIPEADGQVTVTLSGADAALDLVLLDAFSTPNTTTVGACDVSQCTAATANMDGSVSLTFAATMGTAYYFLVDGPANTAGNFTIAVGCS